MTAAVETDKVDEFRRLTDTDQEIQAHGRYFSCNYLLDMIDHQFLVKMHEGRVEDLVVDPGPLDPFDFAIRAGRETWEGFCSPTPPPMCHGIWSATFQRDMTLEGNHLVLMQNLRVLTRQLELLRITGPLG